MLPELLLVLLGKLVTLFLFLLQGSLQVVHRHFDLRKFAFFALYLRNL